MNVVKNCVYCETDAGEILWSDNRCRVIFIADTPFAGLCRVVWKDHVPEFTDIDETARTHLMRVVAAVESGQRKLLSPDKINLAALGTQVPHLHWHVIPRYSDDSHYPDPMWAPEKRTGVVRKLAPDFRDAMKGHLTDALN